ncbi:MAG: NPCBM/NEW2 domain-containing protein [Planctomycetaceae bacterium]|nr:NPCBM/NEW2 domain-containing protein [Planctomycetaceae bacterium]
MNRHRDWVIGIVLVVVCFGGTRVAHAWGKGHRLIRLWAVQRVPAALRSLVPREDWDRLCSDYTSLQDRHAGGNAAELDPYCLVPGVRLSLHDVNPAEPSFKAKRWYLERIIQQIRQGETDEAMKYLGVLCHWNEDPGCPSAHCSPVTEMQLKQLLPPPPGKENLNYLYGYGGIADVGNYTIAEEPYQPRLLGTTLDEACTRIYQHQRLVRQRAAARIVPLVWDMLHGDGSQADVQRAAAALENARHIADVIYTVLCLASETFDEAETERLSQQPLTEWLPEFPGGRVGHPYYVTPFLVNQSMDARRGLHPLRLTDTVADQSIAHGFGMGAPLALNFPLAPAGVFARFTCRVGLHAEAGPEGEVAFAVVANGQELARTRPLRGGEPGKRIDVRLPESGLLTLTLQTIPTDANASLRNLCVWAEPTLHRVE